jgi:16S rRNA processing protein RimM
VVGLLGAPFGLKGFIKVRSLSGEAEHITRLRKILVRREGGEQVYEVEESAGAVSALRIKFQGIDSPEAARALGGAELVTDREYAAPLGADEYYVEDLRGLEVLDEAGESLGRVSDVLEGGGGDLVELRLPGGDLRLIPFRKEFFGEISLERQRAVLLTRWIIE